MLTRELAIAEYDWERREVVPDRLSRGSHHQYRDYAASMLKVYADGVSRTRRELHRDVHEVFAREEACPVRRIDAFCKLLDEVSEFDKRGSRDAAGLRQKVFRLAAPHHPLVERPDKLFDSSLAKIRKQISQQLNMSWSEIERDLFADVIEFQRLSGFRGYASPDALLARYNVAQFQAALFGALQMTVWASRDFKVIVRSAKLARLMHSITRLPDGCYRLVLDGPASVLGETRRYGVAMA